jgi:enoyl-CoA hydratase/carnithine racemase
MTDDAVVLTVEDGIATILLNQPERRNAFTAELKQGLEESLNEIDERDDVRCVVIEGAGNSFAAGGDIDGMVELLDSETTNASQTEQICDDTNELVGRIANLPVPTIAKIDGAAAGAGASVAIACDLQLASDRAVIGFVFTQVGLGVDTGVSYHLPRLVGTNVAKQLVYTGKLVSADEALEIGLVNEVFPRDEFEEKAGQLIEKIASGPTMALRHSKRLIDDGFDQSLESAMADEATAQGVLFDTADHREGLEAFKEDRDPDFSGE